MLAEIDVPGHAESWYCASTPNFVYWPLPNINSKYDSELKCLVFRGVGYPALWPSPNCRQPLDVSNEFTFKLIDGILKGIVSTV